MSTESRMIGESHPGLETVFSARRIAELMAARPQEAVLPTPEQTQVIEQPLGGSVLVIAGAGSGKTETMANRVVWLVANGLVDASQVLGLTFTRKAAGELGERVVDRLQRFAERLGEAEQRGALSASERLRASKLREAMNEGLELPSVSTYNSFASSVVQEFGALAGLASGSVVIDQATAWGLAREVVCSSDDDEIVGRNESIAGMVSRVLKLDHAVADNLTDFDEVQRCLERLDGLARLPYSDKKSEGRYAVIDTVIDNAQATRLTVRLARRFAEQKRSRGLIEFSDQLALAVQTLRRSPEAVRALRARTPVVLLDEVQDTSVGQTALLSLLFKGCSVMAVGDPHQSIYGFRGASASNLRSFHTDFGASEARGAATTLSLSTSWRNPGAVLEAANAVSAPLATRLQAEAAGLAVKPLTSRSCYLGRPESNEVPRLEARVLETLDEEFAVLAEWMRDARNEHLARTGQQPTAAVVFRGRGQMPAVSAALWNAGVPNRIVGLGGLLTTPEVTDLVCLLRCIWQADAGNELLRLLAGPRFRIGAADLRGLQSAAKWFGGRDHAKQALREEDLDAGSVLPDLDRQFTLLDALDEIAALQGLDHSALREISPTGRERLREAGRLLRELRQQVGGDVLALLRAAQQALRLDIELDAAEHTGYDGSAVARANLDAFAELVEGILAIDAQGTLASLLAWLERATEDDEPAEHVPEPEPGTVQLITAHGSKGLEWHLVAIPRMVDGEFPATPREGLGGLRPGELPDELRGDASARPELALATATTQAEVRDAISRYSEALKQRHAEEERRLAYVAITRAASRLLLTCSFWAGQKNPREPAVFLRELERAGLIEDLPRQSEFEVDPSEREGRTLLWPADPLGRRARQVLTAAEAVRARIEATQSAAEPRFTHGLHPIVELLLAERSAEERAAARGVPVVDRVTASTFHEFIENPLEAERRRLRPMPIRPYRRTRTGNLFHEWVERRNGTALGTALELAGLDFEEQNLADTGDLGALAAQGAARGEPRSEPHEELHALIAQFERSRWADRQPIAVELEISVPFAGRTLVCKLDAVYRGGSGGAESEGNEAGSGGDALGDETRYEIVDWKSGKPPKNDAERASRFLQLDLYRHAYALWAGVDPELIDVTLFYVAEGQELRGAARRSLEELEQLWRKAVGSISIAG